MADNSDTQETPKENPVDENKSTTFGRPTKLTADLLLKAREYLGTDKHFKGVLTIEGLALALEVSRETIYAWEKLEQDYDEKTTPKESQPSDETRQLWHDFSDIVTRVRLQQSEKLIQQGLDGTYNPMISKLLLAKHGYVDRSDVTSGNEPIKGALVSFVGDDDSDQPTDTN